MPWYALTSLDSAGIPVKREVLYRDDIIKVWNFIGRRTERIGGIPEGVAGYFISEATADETWDFDIDEPRARTSNAQEVPLIFGEKQKIE